MNDCGQDSVFSCDKDGTCNGSYGCRVYVSGTDCVAQSCNTSTEIYTPVRECDGSGTCKNVATTNCCPHQCANGSYCASSCSSDATHCCGNAICKSSNSKCLTCNSSTTCPNGATCCYGDSCSRTINLAQPALVDETVDVNTVDNKTYYSSTWGASDQFQYTATYGGSAPDRVFHFDTKKDTTTGVLMSVNVVATFDSVIYLRRGPTCGDGGVFQTYNDDCGGGVSSCILDQKLLPNYDWYLYVDGVGSSKGDFTIVFKFEELCTNPTCSCDGSYGETAANNPVECGQEGEYCGNYNELVPSAACNAIAGGCKSVNRTWQYLQNANNEQNYVSWANGSANDKVYKFVAPYTSRGYIQLVPYSTWQPNLLPMMYIYRGATCGGGSGTREYYGWSYSTFGWGSITSPIQFYGGQTYWIWVDGYYEGNLTWAYFHLYITWGM